MLSIFNSHLSGFDAFIIILNLIGASYAAYWNFKSAHDGLFLKAKYSVASMAVIYIIAYAFLLFSNVEIATWSSTLRMFAILAWYFVWAGPPKNSIEFQHAFSTKLEQEVLRRAGIEKEKDGNEQ